MIRPLSAPLVLATLAAGPVWAQTPLTLQDALARARAGSPAAAAAVVAEREAGHRVTQARAGYLPRVDVIESWQRGNQPVFVFSSLLSQRQFTGDDFGLDALNHPDATDLFRGAVTVEQALFNPATRAAVTAADIGRTMAATRRAMVGQDLAASVTSAYARVIAAAAAHRSAAAAVDAAVADRELAANRRDAGLVTDADVLQAAVQISRAEERLIRAAADERVARLQLNELMGEPLDAAFALDETAAALPDEPHAVADLEEEALANRPDVKLAALQTELADAASAAARAAFLPQVTAHGGWEVNGGSWTTRASGWSVGIAARLNVFNGLADRARLAEAREQASRRVLEQERAGTTARLDVRIALARLEAARAAEAAGRAAVAQAGESQRIIRDRYGAGLTDIASLLHAADALAQAESQQIAAQAAIVIEAAVLRRALGRP
jgi:outer membrane protein TolC